MQYNNVQYSEDAARVALFEVMVFVSTHGLVASALL